MEQLIKAAGGIVWKKDGGTYKIAIVYRERHGKEWSLPKGKLLTGEQWHEAAIREVAEEVSVHATILEFADTKCYPVNGSEKLVTYFHMLAGKPSDISPDTEVKKVEWVTPDEAASRLTHSDDVAIVKNLSFPGKPAAQIQILKRIRNWFSGRGFSLGSFFPRYERLQSEIKILKKELPLRAEKSDGTWPEIAERLLDMAESDMKQQNIDSAWKAVHAARRIMYNGFSEAELEAEKEVLLRESEKLNEWRRAAIRNILARENLPLGSLPASTLIRAAELRDDHYNNNYYKNRITRTTFYVLLAILAIVLMFLFSFLGSNSPDMLITLDEAAGEREVLLIPMLWGVLLFGLLGGCISSIFHIRNSSTTTRIPEIVNNSFITITRVLVGGASAIVIFFFFESGFSDQFLSEINLRPDSAITYFILAFAAGFSERLLLRAISSITGKE
jgi:ADP-ribose pyrophosphatase YjhB (NUDIX family)